ncbi:25572_t:CDS:1, partial [Racocetra persica]
VNNLLKDVFQIQKSDIKLNSNQIVGVLVLMNFEKQDQSIQH